ncbi:MAG: CBS domain-containing protein [Proteobacteria bacterium]|nr:CBS domain-containing protein [Desulfobacula sp.]MBU3951556.1 CBS domain-containing protein [Pseudomonadota bacterium]MBU4132246.1 CBS domain-containing protein [Pseudomonadota bacterium]
MKVYAKDIMATDFDTIESTARVEKAIQMILNGRVRETNDKTSSLMVLDKVQMFVGIITMADILYHLRPDFLNYGINGEEVDWTRQFDIALEQVKQKTVNQLMSTQIVGASADEHLMVILDRMVKHKYQRLPVLENGRLIGIVYISDIYYHFFS